MLCKFMVTEGNECMRFHDIASGSQIPNPQTGHLVSVESELTNHSKQTKFHQKHQKPDTDTPLFSMASNLKKFQWAHRMKGILHWQAVNPSLQPEMQNC